MDGTITGEQAHKHDVFISYSSKNKNVADAIVSHFEQNGIRCWYAPRDIMPGQEWVTAIKEGLTDASVFVLIYTNESNDSRQVMNEVALAFNAGKTIVPFRLTEEVMNNELEYYLTRVHWLDAVTKPLNKNIEELCLYVANILQHKPVDASKNVHADKPAKKKINPLKIIIPAVAAVLAVFIALIFLLPRSSSKYFELGLESYNSEYHGEQDDAAARLNFDKSKKQNADAYYYLGMLDERVDNFESAKDNYETGMNLGSGLATARLGYLYQTGNGVIVDLKKARDLYEQAYAGGCKEAAYYKGLLAKNGLFEGEDADANKALVFFEDALHSDDKETVGMTYLMIGELYFNGFAGVDRDYNKAIENYKNAIKTDPAQSMEANYLIALVYVNQSEDADADTYFKKSLEYNVKAADMGNIQSMNKAGSAYSNGKGCEANGQTALEYYQKAEALGNLYAKTNIGVLYRFGKDPLQKNSERAYSKYKEAADKGFGLAMLKLGDMYYNGEYGKEGDNVNYTKAMQWYEAAAGKGYADAYCALGDMYCYGNGVDKDYEKAIAEYQKGIDMGSSEAMLKMGYFYAEIKEPRDDAEAVKWYMKSINAGNKVAMSNMGVHYENGRGVEKDYQEAAKFFRMADEEGYIYATYFLDRLYYHGYLSDDQKTPDYEKAYKYYKKAADAGNAKALNEIGVMYINGYFVEKNVETGKEYYQKAVNGGNKVAAANLGYFALKDKNFKLAREYYEDKGGWEVIASAAYDLGRLYYDDVIDAGAVANDYAKAKKYFLNAEKLGYSDKKNLDMMFAMIGKCFSIEKDFANAAVYYEKAAKQDNTNPDHCRNAGVCFASAKDYNKAAMYYSLSLERGYKGNNDLAAWLKDMNSKGQISKETYEKYAKKWIK